MKFSQLRVATSPKIMIIPMIDVIFFLLVFFMMSSLSMVEQNSFPVNLPQSESAQSDKSMVIRITVEVDGQISINKETVSLELLPERIRTELDLNPEATFILRGDRQVEYGMAVKILDQLKKLGVRKIAIATEIQS